MVLYNCLECNYSTSNKYNYNKHLKTSKHLLLSQKNVQQNVENVEKNVENVEPQNNYKRDENQQYMSYGLNVSISETKNQCFLCSKIFSRVDSLKRHLSICKLINAPKCSDLLQNAPKKLPETSRSPLSASDLARARVRRFATHIYGPGFQARRRDKSQRL